MTLTAESPPAQRQQSFKVVGLDYLRPGPKIFVKATSTCFSTDFGDGETGRFVEASDLHGFLERDARRWLRRERPHSTGGHLGGQGGERGDIADGDGPEGSLVGEGRTDPTTTRVSSYDKALAGGRAGNDLHAYGRCDGVRTSDGTGAIAEAGEAGRSKWSSGGKGDGLLVGEGMSLPGNGRHAVWTRVKTLLEWKEWQSRRIGPSSAPDVVPPAVPSTEEAFAADNATLEDWWRGVVETRAKSPQETAERRQAVVEAVRWAWQGYAKYAWGTDELHPLTRKGTKSFGLGLTIIDSMDTLWLAGEREEFARCVEWVARSLELDIDKAVNVFETTIRVLGGLLAAYHLSGEEVLLQKADDLGRRLAKAFDTPSGIPRSDVNLKTGRAFNPRGGGSSLAEATTLQLEFSYLTEATGDPFFHYVAQRASDAVDAARLQLGWGYLNGGKKQGLAPAFVDPNKGLFGESGGLVGIGGGLVTLGALADSYYEYLLKQWIFSGKTESKYMMRYQEAIRGVEGSLLAKSYPGGLWFVGELNGNTFSPKMDHLACFLPGTLALGHQEEAARDDSHLNLARQLMNTCYQMYERTGTGLAPEIVHFNRDRSNAEGVADMILKPRDRHNLLRPETLESLYYMYWITGEEVYREQAWTIFEAFEQHCRVDRGGYAGLRDVTDVRSKQLNKMETFFVSESLKYLLMIFSEDNPLPFDRYVFNTEAHAFPIP